MALFWRKRKKATLRGRKKKQHGFGRQFVYGFLSMACIGLVVSATWYVTRLPSVTITSVVVHGGETISHDVVRRVAETELVGSYGRLVPKRFTYLYPKSRILERLHDFERIHAIEITTRTRNELSISFSEYSPSALWCASLEDDAPCVFVSNTGIAFADAPKLQGGALIRYVISGLEIEKGIEVLDPAVLNSLQGLSDVMQNELGLRVASITINSDGDFVYALAGGGELLTSPSVRTQDAFENLQSILGSEEFAHLKPGNFKYIDLRFGDKVFVNEELEDTAATTTEDAAEE